jgi:hypothetical protein
MGEVFRLHLLHPEDLTRNISIVVTPHICDQFASTPELIQHRGSPTPGVICPPDSGRPISQPYV